ncbi:pilus assembly protein, partial [Salmonella enterica subsp. enterica serovar Rissen]|nr:pilus assembly protein [Salmonella enterica subsp. enterica serovar Rissen]
GFSPNVATARGPEVWNGETWNTFDTNTPVDIITIGDQDIPPDTYPLTVDVVGYQP